LISAAFPMISLKSKDWPQYSPKSLKGLKK
jgi:hypothetical protein